ncbi:MAG TPA: hypothetical protein VFS67_24955 [Polyangiaceae bacterium]|nr:hypothetical protein [Polyangiaceae bacterium]
MPAPLPRQSAAGNRNLWGSAADTEAYTYVRRQPAFVESIEPRIRPLVLYLVDQLGLITYSSCEGHWPAAGAPFRAAHVGILPESLDEGGGGAPPLQQRLEWLVVAASQTMSELEHPSLGVRTVVDELETELGLRPCIDVWFLPIDTSLDSYFRELPALIERFRCQLERLRCCSGAPVEAGCADGRRRSGE